MTENFTRQVEKQMADRKTDLMHLRVMAELAEPDRQNEYYRIIEEIVARENSLRKKLSGYAAAEAGQQPVLQREIEELWHTTEEAIEVAKAKFLEF